MGTATAAGAFPALLSDISAIPSMPLRLSAVPQWPRQVPLYCSPRPAAA